MDDQLDIIAREIGQKLRTFLIGVDLFNTTIDFRLTVGKYTIMYNREGGDRRLEPLNVLPTGFYEIIAQGIADMQELWRQEEENGEFSGDDTNIAGKYSVDCIIDGEIDLGGTIQELGRHIEALEIAKQAKVDVEDYSGADRILKSIARYRNRIAEAQGGDITQA